MMTTSRLSHGPLAKAIGVTKGLAASEQPMVCKN
jgi:hypothetical protein